MVYYVSCKIDSLTWERKKELDKNLIIYIISSTYRCIGEDIVCTPRGFAQDNSNLD